MNCSFAVCATASRPARPHSAIAAPSTDITNRLACIATSQVWSFWLFVQPYERSDSPQEEILTRRTSEDHGAPRRRVYNNALCAIQIDLRGAPWPFIVLRVKKP